AGCAERCAAARGPRAHPGRAAGPRPASGLRGPQGQHGERPGAPPGLAPGTERAMKSSGGLLALAGVSLLALRGQAGTGTPATPDLSGLWKAEQRFGPDVRGP